MRTTTRSSSLVLAGVVAVAVAAGTHTHTPFCAPPSHFLAFVIPEATLSAAPLLHTPRKTTTHHEEEITALELQEVHHRLLGQPTHAYTQPLPIVDVFTPPKVNLVMMIDGMMTSEDGTGYVAGLAKVEGGEGKFQARIAGLTDMKNAAATYAGAATATALDTNTHTHTQTILCVSTDPSIREVDVCVMNKDKKRKVVQQDPLAEKIDRAFLVREMEGVLTKEEVEGFHMGQAADRKFLSELQSLLQLPTLLQKSKPKPTNKHTHTHTPTPTDFLLFAADGLKMMELSYGAHSQELKLASKGMDAALLTTTKRVAAMYEDQALVSQILLRQPGGLYSATPAGAAARRRLQAIDDDNTPVTDEEIFKVNIIAWTSVGLILTLLMSLCLLFGADSGPKDSLLYAKFQADTSGGKMD